MVNNKFTDLKPLKNYPEYFAGKNGRIYNKKNDSYNLVSNVKKTKKGLLLVTLINTKKIESSVYVHFLIADTWLENPCKYRYVEHINGVLGDNRPENLKWKFIPRRGYVTRTLHWLKITN